MATSQKFQFLASQLMGLGDRFRNEAQQTESNAISRRYQKLAENKFGEDVKRANMNLAFTKFEQAAQQEAANILTKSGKPVTPETLAATLPLGKKNVWVSSPEFQKALGSEFADVFTPKPVSTNPLGDTGGPFVPSAPAPQTQPLKERRMIQDKFPTPKLYRPKPAGRRTSTGDYRY